MPILESEDILQILQIQVELNLNTLKYMKSTGMYIQF
jgi:hypothetical protein